MLRPIYADTQINGLFPISPTAVFQSGMVGGLIQIGGEIFLTVADGISVQPLGILDDEKTEAYSAPSLDEELIIPATPDANGNSTTDVMGFLQETDIIASSFISSVEVILNPKNGVIIVPAGSALNYDNGDQQGFKVVCSYTHEVPGVKGQDTTVGSGQGTLHYRRGFFATDQFDTLVDYPLNGQLYCGRDGKFTTRENGPVVALVVAPPTGLVNELQLMWL